MLVRQAKHSHVTWYVASESDPGVDYTVHCKVHPRFGRIWLCNCPDFTERKFWEDGSCKHILEVVWSRDTFRTDLDLREQGAAKYGSHNWLMPTAMSYVGSPSCVAAYREACARREAYESRLESALDSLKALLEEIRR